MDFATLPVGTPTDATQFDPAVDQNHAVGQSLGGEFQAPSPTEGTPQSITPDPTTTGQQPQTVSYEEYQALKAEFEKKDQLLSGIQQIAERQQEEARVQQFKADLKNRLSGVFQKAVDANSTDEGVEQLFQFLDGEINGVTTTLQGQMDAYYQDVQKSVWDMTADGFADKLIADNGLDPADKAHLMAAANEQDMVARAEAAKTHYARLQQRFGQHAAQAGANQLRQQGVGQINAEGGQVPQPRIQPGATREQLAPVIAEALGISLNR